MKYNVYVSYSLLSPASYYCHAIILPVQNKNSIFSIVHVATYTIT